MTKAGSGNQVIGNFIGLNAAGTVALANSTEGVLLEDTDGATIGGTVAGQGNRIAFNGQRGLPSISTAKTTVSWSSIFSNGQLAIDLGLDGVSDDDAGDADSGANDKQNKPVLAGAILKSDNRIETEAVLLKHTQHNLPH